MFIDHLDSIGSPLLEANLGVVPEQEFRRRVGEILGVLQQNPHFFLLCGFSADAGSADTGLGVDSTKRHSSSQGTPRRNSASAKREETTPTSPAPTPTSPIKSEFVEEAEPGTETPEVQVPLLGVDLKPNDASENSGSRSLRTPGTGTPPSGETSGGRGRKGGRGGRVLRAAPGCPGYVEEPQTRSTTRTLAAEPAVEDDEVRVGDVIVV